jgi:signal transduction histidine kinase
MTVTAQEPHPLAVRIHDRVLQLLAFAMLKTEVCENFAQLGRGSEVIETLEELRSTLEQTADELRAIMADLRMQPAEDGSRKNQAA